MERLKGGTLVGVAEGPTMVYGPSTGEDRCLGRASVMVLLLVVSGQAFVCVRWGRHRVRLRRLVVTGHVLLVYCCWRMGAGCVFED